MVHTAPPTCPLKNGTNTPESSGELPGTITATRTAQRMSSAHLVPFVPSFVELVSRASYISTKKRNREMCWRQSKAQPEISREAAEAMLRGQAPRTDEKFPGIIHVSHQFAQLHVHENVFFCTQLRCRQRWWITEANEVSVRHNSRMWKCWQK